MARPRILLSLVIAVPIVYAVGRLYRPHLGAGLGAALDLLLAIVVFYAIFKVFQKFEE